MRHCECNEAMLNKFTSPILTIKNPAERWDFYAIIEYTEEVLIKNLYIPNDIIRVH